MPNPRMCKIMNLPSILERGSVDSQSCQMTALTRRRDVREQALAGQPWSGILPRINTELLHSRDQRRAVNPHASGSAIRATDTPAAFGEGAHDFFALLSGKFVVNIFPAVQDADGFFDDAGDVIPAG